MLRKDRVRELKAIKNAEINEKIIAGYEYLLFLSDFLPSYKQGTIGEYYSSLDMAKAKNIVGKTVSEAYNGEPITHKEYEIIAAYFYLIKNSGANCSSIKIRVYKKSEGKYVQMTISDSLNFIYKISLGAFGLIESFCKKPSCWTIDITDKERFLLTGRKKKVADFKYTCPEKSYWESFKKSVGATTNAALLFMDDLWQKATGVASSAFSSLEEAYNSFDMKGIDISSDLPSFETKEASECKGWDPLIDKYGQKGIELRNAFEEYNSEDSCYVFLSCHYKNFLDWYNEKKEDLGRQLSITESINLLKEESADCKSKAVQAPITDIEDMGFSRSKEDGYDLDYLLGKNKKFDERYDRSYSKDKCRKDWNQNEIEEYILDIVDGRQPVYYIDEEGDRTKVLSGTRTTRLARRYVRRYFGSLKSIDDNLEAVSKSVLLRLTSEDAAKYGKDRYCKTGEDKKDRSKVFFALQDSFKAGSAQDTEDFSRRDIRKTERQLRRIK